MSIHHECIYNCGGTDCDAPTLKSNEKFWIDASRFKPSESGDYEVKFKGKSDDVGRYNRGFLGLPWLCYWSDEKYGLRTVTHWRNI